MGRKRGPPSTFTKAIARKLCDLVSEGTSLNAACEQLDVPRRRVRNWLVRYPGFGAEMAVAQQLHWDTMAEEVVDIIDRADGSSQSEVTKARAASDARKWVLSKVRPAQYGDRTTIAGDPEAPVVPEQADPGKIALGVMAVLAAAKKAEAPVIDAAPVFEALGAAPAPLPAPRRGFDPSAGKVIQTLLSGDPGPEPDPADGPVDIRDRAYRHLEGQDRVVRLPNSYRGGNR